MTANTQDTAACNDSCGKQAMTCKLTSPELRERKATAIASLKKQVLEKKELPDGFAYKFAGTDRVVDELAAFVKTERQCCDFFNFTMTVKGDGSEVWFTISGEPGVKEFIVSELAF